MLRTTDIASRDKELQGSKELVTTEDVGIHLEKRDLTWQSTT